MSLLEELLKSQNLKICTFIFVFIVSLGDIHLNNLGPKDLEVVFKKNYKRLCNVAFQIVNDRDLAEDLVQELFLNLWQKKESIVIKSTLEGYLVRSISNLSLNHLEKHKHLKFAQDAGSVLNLKASESSDKAITNKELRKIVYAALDKLPPKCRTIFILSRFENMKYKEIAEHLDISIKTVENQMSIAIEKLKGELKTSIKDDYLSLAILLAFLWLQ